MNVSDLNQLVRHICHVDDVVSKLLTDFDDFYLFTMSDQIVVGIVFCCF